MLRLEDYPQTHEGGVDFVRDIFRSMGGTVLPPRRPGHILKYTPLAFERNYFMCDFENACLSQNWDSSKFPKGPTRCEDPEWAAMIQSQVFPHHSDVDWEEYCDWVQGGGGDEWFQEEEEKALFCTKHKEGPLDVWYDCDACVQEVRDGQAPCGCRYVWMSSINGQRQTATDLR